MALAAIDIVGQHEKVVAIARYTLNPRRNYAETAVVVHEDYRRQGVAEYLLEQLKEYAINQGIDGFYSEILPINKAMISLHRKRNHEVKFSDDYDVFNTKTSFRQKEVEKKLKDGKEN